MKSTFCKTSRITFKSLVIKYILILLFTVTIQCFIGMPAIGGAFESES